METPGIDPVHSFGGGRGWLRLDSKGFLLLGWAAGRTVTSADAKAALKAVQQLTNGEPLPILIRINGNDIDPAAAALIRKTAMVSAVALVGATPVDRVIGAKMQRGRQQPQAFFMDEDRAAQWLLSPAPATTTGTRGHVATGISSGLFPGAPAAKALPDGYTEQHKPNHPPLMLTASAEEASDAAPLPCR